MRVLGAVREVVVDPAADASPGAIGVADGG